MEFSWLQTNYSKEFETTVILLKDDLQNALKKAFKYFSDKFNQIIFLLNLLRKNLEIYSEKKKKIKTLVKTEPYLKAL